jgi:hypothetical protein
MLLVALLPALLAAPPGPPSCDALAARWGGLDQAMGALPLDARCAREDYSVTTAAQLWAEATASAAARYEAAGPGAGGEALPGCAQALGEPASQDALVLALRRVEADTRCVDADGEVATLRPLLAPGEAPPRTLERWHPRAEQYGACADGEPPPCVQDGGLVANPTWLKAVVQPVPRLNAAARRAMAEESIEGFDVTVRLVVAPDGSVQSTEWLDGPEWAQPSIARALERWRFEPMDAAGAPAAAAVDLTLRLGSRDPAAGAPIDTLRAARGDTRVATGP